MGLPKIGFPLEWYTQLKQTGVYHREHKPGSIVLLHRIGLEGEIWEVGNRDSRERLIARIDDFQEVPEGAVTTWRLVGIINYL